MKVSVNISNETVQSYLDHYNEVYDTNYQLKKLTPHQRKSVGEALIGEAVGELEMRTDDHGGFETDTYLMGVFPEA